MDVRTENRQRSAEHLDRVKADTAKQAALDPVLARLLAEAKQDFPRALLTVSQSGIQTGWWGAWFQLDDEEGYNVISGHFTGKTPSEAATRALEHTRASYRTPFFGRNTKEINEARIERFYVPPEPAAEPPTGPTP